MHDETRVVTPGPRPDVFRTPDGALVSPPAGWEYVPPGDAALTRRLRSMGPTWNVQETRGRRTFSLGVWAPSNNIVEVRQVLAEERATPAYARKRQADQQRRKRMEYDYRKEFREAVLIFLNFHSRHRSLAERLADAITAHATPVGSGTVARTKQIGVERRAEAAVIAWLRHHTTLYDQMDIPRIRGKRREIRRALAHQSRQLLDLYRRPAPAPDPCQLDAALASIETGISNTRQPAPALPKRLPPGFRDDFFLDDE